MSEAGLLRHDSVKVGERTYHLPNKFKEAFVSIRKPKRRNLKALSGLRTLATLWIVLGHFQMTAEICNSDVFLLVLGRGFIPVCMYILLSGFVTHYAYQSKAFGTMNQCLEFYIRRLARVLFTYYVSVICGMLDPLFTNHVGTTADNYALQVAAAFFLLQSWLEVPQMQDQFSRANPIQPNPGGWTISTLLPLWLLYPVLNRSLRKFGKRTRHSLKKKLLLCVGLYIVAMTPCIIIYSVQYGTMSNAQFELLYKFPPFRLAEFAMAMVCAELVEDPKVNKHWSWTYIPDAACLLFALLVSLVNLNGHLPVQRIDSESFFISGLSPLLALILLGFSINSGKVRHFSVSCALESPVLIELGNWSFPIYCFQFFFFFMFEKFQQTQCGNDFFVTTSELDHKLSAPFLLPYLLSLYCFSAVWTNSLETQFAKFVKLATAKRFSKPEPEILQPGSPLSRTPGTSFIVNGSRRNILQSEQESVIDDSFKEDLIEDAKVAHAEDPEYEHNSKSYDYISATDDEEDIELQIVEAEPDSDSIIPIDSSIEIEVDQGINNDEIEMQRPSNEIELTQVI